MDKLNKFEKWIYKKKLVLIIPPLLIIFASYCIVMVNIFLTIEDIPKLVPEVSFISWLFMTSVLVILMRVDYKIKKKLRDG
jgi:ABC-type xylose transport system permease subunit